MRTTQSHWLKGIGATGILLILALVCWSIIGPRKAVASDLPVVSEARIADFLDSVGICAHLSVTNSSYGDIDRALTQMQSLGIHHYRDDVRGSPDRQSTIMQAARAKGIGNTIVINPARLPLNDQNLQWIIRNRTALDAIEGQNEVDNTHAPLDFESTGRPLYQGVTSYMSVLRTRLHLAGLAIPVLSFTMVHDEMSGKVRELESHATPIPYDVEAVHLYDKDGSGPAVGLQRELGLFRRSTRPFEVTETGYTTIAWSPDNDRKGGREGVSERVQALNTLRTLFETFRLGARRTFLYQLQDGSPDPVDMDKEAHFGLYRIDGGPKPAALYLATMMKSLRSIATQAEAQPGTAQPTPITVAPSPAVHSLRLTWGKTGAMVVIWRTDSLWDNRAHQERTAGFLPQTTLLQLPKGAPNGLAVIDMGSGQRRVLNVQGTSASVPVGASPVVVFAGS